MTLRRAYVQDDDGDWGWQTVDDPEGGDEDGGSPPVALAYAEMPATVSVTGTSEASPTDIVSAGAVVFDGATLVRIEFYSPLISFANGTDFAAFNLWDASTDLGRIALLTAGSVSNEVAAPILTAWHLTPTAGSHTYKIRGWRVTGAAFSVVSLLLNAGVYAPGYVRVTEA